MIDDVINNLKIHQMLECHAREMIEGLVREDIEFSVVCDISHITFDPPLSEALRESLGAVNLFVLSGYSFQSLCTKEEVFCFEAGLITDQGDIGTLLEVPYRAVVQILIQDEERMQSVLLFSNPFEFKTKEVGEVHLDSSIQALLSKNQYLLKKGQR